MYVESDHRHGDTKALLFSTVLGKSAYNNSITAGANLVAL